MPNGRSMVLDGSRGLPQADIQDSRTRSITIEKNHMPIDVPSDAALTLLHDLVAEASAGLVVRATRIAAAGQLVEAGYAIATDIDGRVQLRASQAGVAYQHMIEEWAAED
jgi:hypothetical protein